MTAKMVRVNFDNWNIKKDGDIVGTVRTHAIKGYQADLKDGRTITSPTQASMKRMVAKHA